MRLPKWRKTISSLPGRQRGGALVEYTIVALCLVLILVAVPNDVIHKLMDAVKNAYASFAYALSISWF